MPNKHKAKSKPSAKPKPGAKAAAAHKSVAPKKSGGDKARAKKPTVAAKPAVPVAKPKPAAPPVTVSAPKGAQAKPASKSEAVPADKAGTPPKGGGAAAKPAAGAKTGAPSKKSRKAGSGLRRGSDGELFTPGEVLVPGGVQTTEEVFYLFRGVVAAERPSLENGVTEVLNRPPAAESFPKDPDALRTELQRQMELIRGRFDSGRIETALPNRVPGSRRTFAEVVERARGRRREIGAFLRGLDLGRTETSHMDSHGEASLQSLMEWAARLENLAEADERDGADYAQVHRGLDQLDGTTEALIIDVEQTLRRLRDRISRR
jgi:hypothetical protein